MFTFEYSTRKSLSRADCASLSFQVKVRAVAKGMVVDFESGAEGLKEWNNADLKKFEA
jgi:hypothetical protein